MTKKTFKKIDKKGHEETWEWEETPEVVAALKKLHASVDKNRVVTKTSKLNNTSISSSPK